MNSSTFQKGDQILFLSASFDDFQIGLSQKGQWIYKKEASGHIADHLQEVLQDCMPKIDFAALKIFLIHGPGSTLGIRSLCAFIRTLCALKKIQADQIYTTNGLTFAQAYLALLGMNKLICARVNLTQTLCLKNEDLCSPSEEEKQVAIWLPHPCLKEQEIFKFTLDQALPILQNKGLWIPNPQPDVFQS